MLNDIATEISRAASSDGEGRSARRIASVIGRMITAGSLPVGTRLPTVIWAYPREYSDAETAGQVSGSSQRFTMPLGASLVWLRRRR